MTPQVTPDGIRRELAWVLRNYLLLALTWLGVGIVWGASLVLASPDGRIPGYGGSPLEQVLWFATGTVFFLPLTLGLPVLLAMLVLWRSLVRATHRPRLTAYLLAVAVAGAALLALRPDVLSAIVLVIAPVLVFASLVRPPRREVAAP